MKIQVDNSTFKKDPDGILYVVRFDLEGKKLVKIGITTKTIEERVSNILVDIFKVYRAFPYCKPKRFTRTTEILSKEKQLHEHFDAYRYTPEKKFGGCTEFFNVPLSEVVVVYDELLGKVKN